MTRHTGNCSIFFHKYTPILILSLISQGEKKVSVIVRFSVPSNQPFIIQPSLIVSWKYKDKQNAVMCRPKNYSKEWKVGLYKSLNSVECGSV